ncbi:hypothetical protein T07_264 [Trichinella nelsoni]|uniref:Uncharacterized protein n=1 Tax=Trichinella nelsoni TaxID=6336 RepID=A0A0V0RN12_9BILA|nr:hypothetical protein T07_264 [Trichinella nelsoni]
MWKASTMDNNDKTARHDDHKRTLKLSLKFNFTIMIVLYDAQGSFDRSEFKIIDVVGFAPLLHQNKKLWSSVLRWTRIRSSSNNATSTLFSRLLVNYEPAQRVNS